MSKEVAKINNDSVFKFLEPKQEELIKIVGNGNIEQGKAAIAKEMSFAIQAANKNGQLRNASPASVAVAIYNTLITGLSLNPLLELCDIVPYETSYQDNEGNWRSRVEAQMQPRYGGMLKLTADSGAFKDAPFCACVYVGDEFSVSLGSNRIITHIPKYLSDKDEDITHVYCVISLANGGSHIEVMPISEVIKIRNRAKGYMQAEKNTKRNSVWHNFFPKQSLKTVLKRALKTVPKSSFNQEAMIRLQQAIAIDNNDYDMESVNHKELNETQVQRLIEAVKVNPEKVNDFVDALIAENVNPATIEVIKSSVAEDKSESEQVNNELSNEQQTLFGDGE